MTILFSLLLDMLFGDPPNRFHPVAWMGSTIAALQNMAPEKDQPLKQLAYGGLLSLSGGVFFALLGRGLTAGLKRVPSPLRWLLEAGLLKTTIGLRGLDQAAGEVQSALENGDLDTARHSLRFHLVSRDTAELNASQAAAATVESVAENASDGVLGPLVYYLLGGLPAALFYRFINTADAMLGYRDREREWLGKIPARLDDLLNLLPARLSGLLIALAAGLRSRRFFPACQTMHRDSGKTASPNAGWPMSAMAGALNVELEKVDHYTLGEGNPAPETHHLGEARSLLKYSILLGGILLTVLSLGRSSDSHHGSHARIYDRT